jgi:hypothetical protein
MVVLAGLFGGVLSVGWLGLPLWTAAALTLGLLIIPGLAKWREDARLWGRPVMVLSMLLFTQTGHTVEHLAQWVQFHLLGWPAKASSGLISPLNAEVVHFTWNWAVLLVVVYLVAAGLRNVWMWLLLLWAMGHTAEHTFMFINYLQSGGVQGLPGFFGKGGWLAAQEGSSSVGAWLCTLAPAALKSAPRLDVHFWWNVGEIVLLLCAAQSVARRLSDGSRPVPPSELTLLCRQTASDDA